MAMTTTATTMLTTMAAAVATLLLLLASPAAVSGQAVVPGVGGGGGGVVGGALSCPASVANSIRPCLNFLTTDTASPTDNCCRSLGALVQASSGCACLVLTGAVPLGVPVNRTVAVSLPRACNSSALQLQCRDASSAQSPAPGPVADAPAPSMLAPLPPATPAATTEPEAPAPAAPVKPTATATAPISQGQTRQTVVPSSAAWRASSSDVPATAGFVLLSAVGALLIC